MTEFRKYEKTITVTEVCIAGEWFDTNRVYGLLEELLQVDGFFSNMVIYDSDLAKALERAGLAFRNAKGSYAPAKNAEAAIKALINEIETN